MRSSQLVWLLGLVAIAATLPATTVAAAPSPACAGVAAAEQSAVDMARACRVRVEVTGERTERSLTFANPDGSLTTTMSPTPQRVRKRAKWVDVDPTLVTEGGAVVPRAVTESLVLSAGGEGPLLAFGGPGKRFTLTWPAGALPKPRLEGASATYPDVLPGVDLRVEAGVNSYRQLLVVKDRDAASNPALSRIAMQVSGDGLTMRTRPDGRIDAVDAAGAVVYASPGALMWDSPAPALTPAQKPGKHAARSAAEQEGERNLQAGEPTPHRTERMPVELTGDQLAVVPVQAMLTAPDTVYPVTIDPTFSKPSPMWYTNVMDDEPNRSFYGDYSELRVGRQWATSHVWRAHMQFDTTELKGATITTAELSVTADHTADCASTSIQLWQTQPVASPGSYTWRNDSDGDWISKIDTKTFSANESSCPKGDDTNVFSGTIKAKLQATVVAKTNANRFTVGLRATSEANEYEWTRFIGNKTFLTVTYNRKPNLPTDQAITDCYLNCSKNPLVSRKDPELSVFATDPDKSSVLTVFFEVQTSAGVAVAAGSKTGYATGPTKPAQPAKWRITPKLGDGTYRWRAYTKDGQNLKSDTTGWFGFSTDSTAPSVPEVKPVDPAVYFEDDDSGACSGGIGVPGSLSLSAETSVLQFAWALDGGAFSAPVPASGTSPKTAQINVRPIKDMVRTFRVRSYDGAGRFGEASYEFRVCSPQPEAGHWKLDGNGDDDSDLISAPHNGVASNVAWVQSRHAATPDQPDPNYPVGDYEARFAGTGAISTAAPVVATGTHPETGERRSFGVAAWIRVTDINSHRTALSQQGSVKSIFELGYQFNEHNYCFSMFASDSISAPATRACSVAPVVAGEWVHLAGVYDGATGTMTLYLHRKGADGFIDPAKTEVRTASFTSIWDSAGAFTIGRAIAGAVFVGDIDEVWAWQRTPEQAEIQFLALN